MQKAQSLRIKNEEEERKNVLENIRKKEIQVERRRRIVSLLIEYGIKESKKRVWFSHFYLLKIIERMKEMLEVTLFFYGF